MDIDDLVKRLRHVQANLRPHSELCKESADAIETLRAELEEARKDAERWKQWKNWWMHDESEASQLPPAVEAFMENLDLDEAIDAARQQQG